MKLSKRSFLRLIAAFAAVGRLTLPGRTAAAANSPDTASVLSLFGDPESAAVVGRRYLQLHPDEADADRLLQLLEDALRAGAGDAAAAPGGMLQRRDLPRLVHAAVRRDFEQGGTAEVDGWILARTEVRACALAEMVLRSQSGHRPFRGLRLG